jgi:hypothetical protein
MCTGGSSAISVVGHWSQTETAMYADKQQGREEEEEEEE